MVLKDARVMLLASMVTLMPATSPGPAEKAHYDCGSRPATVKVSASVGQGAKVLGRTVEVPYGDQGTIQFPGDQRVPYNTAEFDYNAACVPSTPAPPPPPDLSPLSKDCPFRQGCVVYEGQVGPRTGAG